MTLIDRGFFGLYLIQTIQPCIYWKSLGSFLLIPSRPNGLLSLLEENKSLGYLSYIFMRPFKAILKFAKASLYSKSSKVIGLVMKKEGFTACVSAGILHSA